MKQNFDDCLTRVLKDEGGYSNNPNDSGGPTNFGITLTDYRKYIDPQGTASSVRRMSADDAKRIYKTKYWDTLSCDTLPSGVDYSAFDYGVNSGIGRPRKLLQQFANKSGVDLINAINDEREAFLTKIGHGKNAEFEAGWQARVKRVRNYSIFLNSNQPKNNVAGPSVATGLSGLALAFSQFWHQHEIYIITGGVIAAIVAGFIIHSIINKGK
jgi:lysozyme family protein